MQAPAEAEAQCCSMAKAGLVDVVATEDMDALTFGAPKLVRNMMSQTSGKDDVAAREYNYDKVGGQGMRHAVEALFREGCITLVLRAY